MTQKSRFVTGNVIKTAYGSIEIVTDVRDDGYTTTIPIDYTNSSAGYQAKSYEVEEWCDWYCTGCEYCDEGKPYKRTVFGMDKATLVASTIKEWIIKSSTHKFFE